MKPKTPNNMKREDLLKDAYVERDVSWMYFNRRILQEAEKDGVSPMERLARGVDSRKDGATVRVVFDRAMPPETA